MKQLSNFIRIMPLAHFQSFDGTTLTGLSEPDLINGKNDLELMETPQSNSPGLIYEQSLNVVCTKLSAALRKKYAHQQPVVVLIYDDADNPQLWGDSDEKLRVTITPKIYYDILSLNRKSATPLL